MFSSDGCLLVGGSHSKAKAAPTPKTNPLTLSHEVYGAYMNAIGYNPHSRVPLKTSGADKLDWRPKVGERTSHEYGAAHYKLKDEKTRMLREVRRDMDVLGEVDVAKERSRADGGTKDKRISGLGRRPKNLEPAVPPTGE
eukprot:1128283-Prymnesium_polylepis.1